MDEPFASYRGVRIQLQPRELRTGGWTADFILYKRGSTTDGVPYKGEGVYPTREKAKSEAYEHAHKIIDNMPMTPEEHAIEVLLGLGRYAGPADAFMRESETRVRAKLNSADEEAKRVIQELRNDKEIDFRIDPMGSSPPPKQNSGFKWFIPGTQV
jgi:hypothetical protein